MPKYWKGPVEVHYIWRTPYGGRPTVKRSEYSMLQAPDSTFECKSQKNFCFFQRQHLSGHQRQDLPVIKESQAARTGPVTEGPKDLQQKAD